MTTIGTLSEYAWATPPNAFSVPGPCCIANTPTRSPELSAADRVGHVQASALLADDDRPDVGLGGRLDDRIDRVADQAVDAFTLQDLGDRGSNLHVLVVLLLR